MRKRKKSGFGVVATIAIIALLVNFGLILADQQKVLYAKKLEMRNVEDKIAEEKKLKEELQSQKESLNSDEYVEKVAREKLGMVKPGEKIFVDVNE